MSLSALARITMMWVGSTPTRLSEAAALGLGVFSSRPRIDASYAHVPSATLLGFGTVVTEGESLESPRVVEVAGEPAAVGYHEFFEQNDVRLSSLPNADLFVALAAAVPEETRHLKLHTWPPPCAPG